MLECRGSVERSSRVAEIPGGLEGGTPSRFARGGLGLNEEPEFAGNSGGVRTIFRFFGI